MDDQEQDLDALVARLADGDRSVFTDVFHRLWPPTHRLCLRMLSHEADAADAAQTAMEKIFERAMEYDRARPAMPWALAITAWECRTIRRKRSRRREAALVEPVEGASSSVEDDVVRRDLIAAAIHAMGDLAPADREALLATFGEEEASVAGATLRKRRQRALERLRRTFRRLYG